VRACVRACVPTRQLPENPVAAILSVSIKLRFFLRRYSLSLSHRRLLPDLACRDTCGKLCVSMRYREGTLQLMHE
jgi:hypothetical protein